MSAGGIVLLRTYVYSGPLLVDAAYALLFVGGVPLTAVRAAEIIRGLTAAQFVQARVLHWREMVGPVIAAMLGAGVGVAMAYFLSGRFEPYLRRFAAYYYNQAMGRGEGVAINYKNKAFPDGAAVLDVERGQLAAIRPFFWQTDTSISKNSWVVICAGI